MKGVIDTSPAERISHLRLMMLAKAHPEFSKSIGLKVSLRQVRSSDSELPSCKEPSAAAAVGNRDSHD